MSTTPTYPYTRAPLSGLWREVGLQKYQLVDLAGRDQFLVEAFYESWSDWIPVLPESFNEYLALAMPSDYRFRLRDPGDPPYTPFIGTAPFKRLFVPQVEVEKLLLAKGKTTGETCGEGGGGVDVFEHNQDFTHVRRKGKNYKFTPDEAEAIRRLVVNCKAGNDPMKNKTLMTDIPASRDNFKSLLRANKKAHVLSDRGGFVASDESGLKLDLPPETTFRLIQ